jgi:hypothetical protein
MDPAWIRWIRNTAKYQFCMWIETEDYFLLFVVLRTYHKLMIVMVCWFSFELNGEHLCLWVQCRQTG